ncbi:pimeloyl-ACP methyl ester carboxylesterase [Bradyrhizobium sp. GM5.1]
MPSFHNGAVEIAYLDEGEGDPIILVHGFASSKNVNWVYPTWVSELRKNGRRVIALDNRGHGESAKLYEPAQYSIPTMAGDVLALMDHLAIPQADLMGYSMGGRMTAWLSLNEPQRLRSAILGGIGIGGLIEGTGPGENVAKALEAPSLDDVSDPVGRTFRAFADQTRSDPQGAGRLPARHARSHDEGRSRAHRRARADRGRQHRRRRGFGQRTRCHHPGFGSARYSRSRSHARSRRQGLQDWRARFPLTPRLRR